jgi:EpsI family protein
MSRMGRFAASALFLMGATQLLVLLAGRTVVAVTPPAFGAFPSARPGWIESDRSGSPLLPPDPRAERHLIRTYQDGKGEPVWVAVDYYSSQAQDRRPAARELVFPARGWTDLSEQAVNVPVDTSGHSLPANLVTMRVGSQRVAIVYWYQLRERSVASDHGYRALLAWNRIVHGRRDGALVRLAFPLTGENTPDACVARAAEFLRAFYADLLAMFVR